MPAARTLFCPACKVAQTAHHINSVLENGVKYCLRRWSIYAQFRRGRASAPALLYRTQSACFPSNCAAAWVKGKQCRCSCSIFRIREASALIIVQPAAYLRGLFFCQCREAAGVTIIKLLRIGGPCPSIGRLSVI